MKARVGRETHSGLYYENLGEGTAGRPPLLFIHGGGVSGDHFRATPDGRMGWADLLAGRGYQVWVTDWPGTGRSGYRDIAKLEYDDVVDGYRRVLVRRPWAAGGVVARSTGGAPPRE